MTSNDVFLGGGSNSGQFNRANLPNIIGKSGVINSNSSSNPSTSYIQIQPDYSFVWTSHPGNVMTGSGTGCFTNYLEKPNSFANVTLNRLTATVGTGILNYTWGQYIDGNKYVSRFGIDASLYNSIYNNSNRVNPNYYTIEFWIKFK